MDKNIAGEFVMRLFHARTAAHVLHLQSRSYSQHKALETFYEDIVDLADTFAEVWQGEYGLIPAFDAKYISYTDPLELTTGLASWIDLNRKKIGAPDDTHLQNIIDEVFALVSQTEYKLRFLK